MFTLLPIGSIFAGRYRVGRCIASGGMGAVHEVEHVETGRLAALKVMLPHVLSGEGAREQFKTEARVAARLRSDHVVDVLDAGFDEETQMPFLVMELLQGEDFAARLRRTGPMPREEALVCLLQVARALDRVHRSGIVHRDLKPENLFLSERDDGSPLVKVLDFGISKVLAEGATSAVTFEARGTPVYMSPEQFTHEMKISSATDIYALGMVAYTLLSGSAYWSPEIERGMNVFLIARLAEKGPSEPATARARSKGVELPAAFDAWFSKATAADPKERFAQATEAVRALAEALGVELPANSDRPSLPGPESQRPSFPPEGRTSRPSFAPEGRTSRPSSTPEEPRPRLILVPESADSPHGDATRAAALHHETPPERRTVRSRSSAASPDREAHASTPPRGTPGDGAVSPLADTQPKAPPGRMTVPRVPRGQGADDTPPSLHEAFGPPLERGADGAQNSAYSKTLAHAKPPLGPGDSDGGSGAGATQREALRAKKRLATAAAIAFSGLGLVALLVRHRAPAAEPHVASSTMADMTPSGTTRVLAPAPSSAIVVAPAPTISPEPWPSATPTASATATAAPSIKRPPASTARTTSGRPASPTSKAAPKAGDYTQD